MNGVDKEGIAVQARALLRELRDPGGRQSTLTADDLLLFCYRLRDGYRIVRSGGEQFKGSSFTVLHELLYQLESRPDETMHSAEWRTMIETLLSDLALGRIVVTKK